MASSTLHGPSLFSVRERTDARPRAHQEPSYAFLDRAAGARWTQTRARLDEWFQRLPEAARADVRNRFALHSELDHAGAFWELWVHEAHRRRGFDVTVNIGVEAGERRQDFVLARDGERCWLEATVVGGDSPLTFTEQRLGEQLRDLVETVHAPGLSLALEVARYGTCTPARRRVAPRIEGWLASLDRTALRAARAAGAPAPSRRLAFDDWQIELEAIALDEPLGSGERRLVGSRSTCGGSVNDVRPLRRKIKKKAARYGELDRPYLLAVLALGSDVSDRDVSVALLGAGETCADGSGRPRSSGDHAVWIGPGGPHNTRLSGVLVARGLHSVGGEGAPPTLWSNPWALRPLGLELPWQSAPPAVIGRPGRGGTSRRTAPSRRQRAQLAA
jgi:hypothetical protein